MRKGNKNAASVNPVAKSVQLRDCKTKTPPGCRLAGGVRAKRQAPNFFKSVQS